MFYWKCQNFSTSFLILVELVLFKAALRAWNKNSYYSLPTSYSNLTILGKNYEVS